MRRKHFLLKQKFLQNVSFTYFLHFDVEKFVMGRYYNKFLETIRYIDGIIEDVCSSGHTLSARAQAILSELLLLIGSFILLGYIFHKYFTESHYSLYYHRNDLEPVYNEIITILVTRTLHVPQKRSNHIS